MPKPEGDLNLIGSGKSSPRVISMGLSLLLRLFSVILKKSSSTAGPSDSFIRSFVSPLADRTIAIPRLQFARLACGCNRGGVSGAAVPYRTIGYRVTCGRSQSHKMDNPFVEARA